MGHQQVIIGSKSKCDRGQSAEKRTTTPTNRKYKPRQMVDVYLREFWDFGYSCKDHFVETVPLLLLVRFSKGTAEVFPKPAEPNQSKAAGPNDTQIRAANGLLVANDSSPVSQTSTETLRPRDQPRYNKRTPSNTPHEYLSFWLDGVKSLPSPESVSICLRWMYDNKDVHGDHRLSDLMVPEPDRVTLTTLVDLHAAAQCLSLRPPPSTLRRTILDRLSAQKPLYDEISYIGEHVMHTDGVVTRAITAYHENLEAGHYSKEEIAQVDLFVDWTRGFATRFHEIRKARLSPEQRLREQQEEEYFARTGWSMPETIAGTAHTVQPSPESKRQGGSRRIRRRPRHDIPAQAETTNYVGSEPAP